jgi:hypothetical protein
MVLFNYALKELTAKIVYYGPGLSGKTTNLQYIYEELPIKNKGRMLTLATETDRTLYFDFLPVDAGIVRGIKTRIQLYTVPGQVFYNATRQMVLKGADGVVFVADSQAHTMEANQESFSNLRENLLAHDLRIDELPLVLQYNKRDLPNILGVDDMNELLNTLNAPFYEAVAIEGIGVEDTLKAIGNLVLKSVIDKYGGQKAASGRLGGASRAAAANPGGQVAQAAQVTKMSGFKSKEDTGPFGVPSRDVASQAAVASPRARKESKTTPPVPASGKKAQTQPKGAQAKASKGGDYEELNLDEILGEAASEPEVVLPREEPDLVDGLEISSDEAGEASFAGVLEEALKVEDPEASELAELRDSEDMGIIEARLDALSGGAVEEEEPVEDLPSELLEPPVRRAAATDPSVTSFDVRVNTIPPKLGVQTVVVPLHVQMDPNAEDLDLQITLQIRITRPKR